MKLKFGFDKVRYRGLAKTFSGCKSPVRCSISAPHEPSFSGKARRKAAPEVTCCLGCGRTTSTYFQKLAEAIQSYLVESMPEWKKVYLGVEELKLAVMGCIVNGLGESKHANIGISLPGTFEDPKTPVYVHGKLLTTLKGNHIVEEFQVILNDYVQHRYGSSVLSILHLHPLLPSPRRTDVEPPIFAVVFVAARI